MTEPRTVVLAGDSHLTPTSRWGTRKLGPRLRECGYAVIDLARGGLSSRDAIDFYRNEWPSGILILSLGGNDAAPWKAVPVATFRENLVRLASRAQRALIMTPAPVCGRRQAGRTNDVLHEYARAAEDAAERVGAGVIPLFDWLTELMKTGVDVHVGDGVHLNNTAYEEMARRVHDLVPDI